jgi:TRAP-type C4-dicarboxylate transport system substrate-binding protein
MLPKNIIRCIGVFFLIFIFLFVLPAGTIAKNKIVLKFGDETTPQNPIYKANVKFVELVNERTKGRVEIQYFGSGQIGKGRALNEACFTGGIDMALSSDGNLAEYTHAYDFQGLPYLFGGMADEEKFWHTDNLLKREVIKQFERDLKSKPLMFFYSGGAPRHLLHSGKKVIRVPQDLRGMKIRTTGAETEVAVLKSWGAGPTPVDWGEVYLALQQGTVDGTYNQDFWSYLNKFHEVCKGVTELNANWVISTTFISHKAWKKLSKEDQQIFLDAAKEANMYGNQLNKEVHQWGKKKMIEAGVKYYTPTPEEELLWKNAAMETWDRFVGKEKIRPSFIGKLVWHLRK